jgi:hypothetical protein
VSWRHKSRALWLREGDKNTYLFFHQVANSPQRNNSMESSVINGSMASDSTEIREHIVQFYNRLYFEQFSW